MLQICQGKNTRNFYIQSDNTLLRINGKIYFSDYDIMIKSFYSCSSFEDTSALRILDGELLKTYNSKQELIDNNAEYLI